MDVFAKLYEIRIKEQIIPSECTAYWRGEDVIFQVKFYTDSAEEHAPNTVKLRGREVWRTVSPTFTSRTSIYRIVI